MEKSFLCLIFLIRLISYLCLVSVSSASAEPLADVHFCLPLDFEDMRARDSIYAARKHAYNLNVGEPRMVRMIYFLPNDRPFRQEVVDSMKVKIRQVQTFYAEQMEAHGHGYRTFRFETDAQGEPLIHRVDGQHPNSQYLRDTYTNLISTEIGQAYDLYANIYFIILDSRSNRVDRGSGRLAGGFGGSRDKNGGFALLTAGYLWPAAHELGHAFGLQHDFRDNTYIMSYGRQRRSLSACHAKYLSVHPYFNPDIPIEEVQSPTVERMSPVTYPAGANSVSVQLKVSDSDGLHQVLLFVRTREPHFAAGSREVKACRELTGKKETIVEFDYHGGIPSAGGTSLSNPVEHPIIVEVVDTDGNVSAASFMLREISPQYIAALEGHTDWVLSMSFSPDGITFASGGSSGTIKLWDVVTKEDIFTFEDARSIGSVVFSPDGKILAAGTYRVIKLWDVSTRANFAALEGHTDWVLSMSFSPDGTMLASGSWDRTAKLWDVSTRANFATFEGHTGGVYSVSFSPDGTTLASGSSDGTVLLWDVAIGEQIAILEGHKDEVKAVGFSPDGTMLASGSSDGSVKLWDVATKREIVTLPGRIVNSVSFSPDGAILATGSAAVVKLWDVSTRANIATFEGHTNGVYSLEFSLDGTTLASGSADGTVLLWDVSDYVTPVVYIPDANLRAVIRSALGESGYGPITREDMASLTTLDARNRNIRQLKGLEFATNLTELNLTGNPLSSLSFNTHIPALQERGVEVLFQRPPTSDFNGDGIVSFGDFLLFVAQFGFSEDDEGYEARFDLDGDDVIGFGDFLIFVNAFGSREGSGG